MNAEGAEFEYRFRCGRPFPDGVNGRCDLGQSVEVHGDPSHDLHAVLADGDHGVASLVVTAGRNDHPVTTNDAYVFRLRNGKAREFWEASIDQAALYIRRDAIRPGAPHGARFW
jgi:hypothetical protein